MKMDRQKQCKIVNKTNRMLTLTLILVISSNFVRNCISTPNVYNLHQLLTCTTNFSLNQQRKLSNYGCFCGKGNTFSDLYTFHPRDEIDSCCRSHDFCFGKLHRFCEGSIETVNYYNVGYRFECENDSKIVCGDSNSNTNSTNSTSCQSQVCACDSALANCLSERSKLGKFYNFDKSLCLGNTTFSKWEKDKVELELFSHVVHDVDQADYVNKTVCPEIKSNQSQHEQLQRPTITKIVISAIVIIIMVFLGIYCNCKLSCKFGDRKRDSTDYTRVELE